jgi:nucleoside-diphosphate-sugar epimerase
MTQLSDGLKGRCCAITGGAGIIGCSLVEALAGRGVNVTILDLNAAGGDSPRATTAVEMVEDTDLDHLERTFFGLEMEAFRKVFDLNFIGTLLPS